MGRAAALSDRWARLGWRTSYTPLGGRHAALRVHPAFQSLSSEERDLVSRLTSGAYLAVNREPINVDADLTFFLEVMRKLLQRGTNPTIGAMKGVLEESATSADLVRAAIGPLDEPSRGLDPSIKLHDAYEQPLWDAVQEHHPTLARFFVPQASLEALAGLASGSGERWVDFALLAPWMDRPVVVELDGGQHHSAGAVDRSRDAALTQAGFRVSRHPGGDAVDASGRLRAALAWTASQAPDAPIDQAVLDYLHLPPTYTRVAMALVELLAVGAVEPGGDWHLELVDEAGWAGQVLPLVLELLLAVTLVWGVEVAPRAVTTNQGSWSRHGASYRSASGRSVEPVAALHLEPFVPAHAPLPQTALPTVVIRGAPLAGPLAWLPQKEVSRRDVALKDEGLRDGLDIILRHLFGFDRYREGQRDAISHALAGMDACVLLPTGAGKSLIYQVAGLLRPGITLIVDPLVSLVDDQERRLRQDGVDRVTALTSARLSSREIRDQAYEAVSDGDSLVIFLTPERLQIQAFRDALGRAAVERSVGLAVIDEAHCVSEWGHDFRTAYLRVGRNIRLLSRGNDDREPPLIALTGTASPAVLRDVLVELEHADRPMAVLRPDSFDRPNLSYQVLAGPQSDWESRLDAALVAEIPRSLHCDPADLSRLHGDQTLSGIVFVPHTNGTYGVQAVRKHVRKALASSGAPEGEIVGIYSGGAPRDIQRAKWDQEKAKQADAFKENRCATLVATKAFGMGIDKPNIRWTIHVGHPSSIEAFAQEAGRAGRDGRPAHCVLVASPAGTGQAEALLDIRTPGPKRAELFSALKGGEESDLSRQYYFLTSSFKGVSAELSQAREVMDALMSNRPGSRVELPKMHQIGDQGSDKIEKALYRLSLLGIVDDYTIDHGGRKYVIDLAMFDEAHIDTQLTDFVRRVEPGRSAQRQRQIATAPAGLRDRTEHHLQLLLTILYDVIEPARVRALHEMHLFATSGEDDAGLRARILAYLSDGPLAGILNQLAGSERLDVREVTRQLDTVPASDPREWIGSAARQLEVFPDHPVLLLVRGLGEALLREPDRDMVANSFRECFATLDSYDVEPDEQAQLLTWAGAQLRNQQRGRGWAHVLDLYVAWTDAGGDDGVVKAIEDQVMRMAVLGQSHPAELNYVLSRRMSRHVAEATTMTQKLTGASP